jgi:hypothetical protein
MNLLIEAERRTTRDQVLQLLYGLDAPDEEAMEEFPFPRVTLRHVRVTDTVGPLLRLRDIHDGEQFGPMLLPRPLWKLVLKGDVFEVCLGLEETKWVFLFARAMNC